MSFMAGIKCPKNGHACINFACQNGSAINCQWQQVETSTNTTLRPESPLNKKTRESGHFWVRRDHWKEWVIAEYVIGDGWYLPGNPNTMQDEWFSEIDERRITREGPIAAKISGTSVRTPQNE